MSEDSSGNYALHILNAHDVKWDAKICSKVPDLYILVECGRITKRTQTVKKTLSPTWDESLTFSSSEASMVIHVRLHHNSLWLSDPCIGYVDISVADLLSKCANGEGQLSLEAPARKRRRKSSAPTGIIHLRLEAASASRAASIELKAARKDVQRLASTQPAGAVGSSTIAILDDATHTSDDNDLSQSLGDLFSKLDALVKYVDTFSEIHPYLYIAWKLTSALYKRVSNQIKVDTKLIDLVRTMVEAFDFLRDTQSLLDKTRNLEKRINELLKQITECCYFVRQYTRPGFIGRLLDLTTSQKIDEFKDSFVRIKNALDASINLHTAFVSARTSDKVDAIYLQSRLNPDETDAFSRPQCLRGTRVAVRTEIMDLLSADSDQNVLWLRGVAGSGKSTVSTTVAEYFRTISRLGAFLFFERGKSEPNAVIRTLAYKLASFNSTIAKHVIAAFENDNDIAKAPAASQFEKLIMEPLTESASAMQGPVFIILDAMDECGTPESRKELMRLISQKFPKLPSNFRFLFTSRPEADIMHALTIAHNSIREIELDYTSEASRSDVLTYLRHEMNKIIRSVPEVQIPKDWPWDSNIKLLAEVAEGLFIWASTAVKLVASSDSPFRKLKDLIADSQSLSKFGLDELYATVLRSSGISWDDEASRDRFSKVLTLLLISKVPVSNRTIDGILGFPPEDPSYLILSKLRCLLSYSPNQPISLFHASFSDYLTSSNRTGEPWSIDIVALKSHVATRCFSVMKDLLRFNICNIETSFIRNEDIPDLGTRIQGCIPSHLAYASVYWYQHLCEVPYSRELSDQLSTFAHQGLLFWFEVLSLLKTFGRTASQSLLKASIWAKPRVDDLSLFLADASDRASAFGSPITESTPHIYVSMLPLMKHDSTTAAYYSKQTTSVVRVDRIGMKAPPQWLRVFEGHAEFIRSVAFSSDGERIVSGSDDRTIKVWDLETGELIASTLAGHKDGVECVAISPDGRHVVSGSRDATVRVWDTQNGEAILSPFEGHSSSVFSVAYSPDGMRIVSGSEDKTLRLWGAVDGKLICKPFEGHSDLIYSVVFSPDGKHLASGSADRTVRVWSVESQKCIFRPFKGHTDAVRSVTFSPDGKLVVSGSQDRTIRIWRLDSSEVSSRIIDGHTGSVYAVSISPDGTRIASSSGDRTVRISDVVSGKPISGPLEGHANHVLSVTFSPDGTRILSGSMDKTLRLWDSRIANVDSETISQYGKEVTLFSVAVSPDGLRIVSGCSDKTIRIWNIDGKSILEPFTGHAGPVLTVAFSPDGTLVASGSRDKTIRVWNVDRGECVLGPFKGHTDGVRSVAFSSDGTRIASGSHDKTVRVWDIANSKSIAGPFEKHEEVVWSVAFSADGSRVISCSPDKTVIIWDASSGEIILGPLKEHTDWVNSVAFSPEGSRFISGSGDKSFIVWDAEDGKVLLNITEAHSDYIVAVTFSQDGSLIVSGSDDGTVGIWNSRDGKCIWRFGGHAAGVRSVALSPDAMHIITGSGDNTIRVWNMAGVRSPKLSADKNSTSLVTCTPYEGFPDWNLNDNGWIEGPHKERLIWIPPDLRASLWYPRNSAVFGCAFSTKLDFRNTAIGDRWQECFNPIQ